MRGLREQIVLAIDVAVSSGARLFRSAPRAINPARRGRIGAGSEEHQDRTNELHAARVQETPPDRTIERWPAVSEFSRPGAGPWGMMSRIGDAPSAGGS